MKLPSMPIQELTTTTDRCRAPASSAPSKAMNTTFHTPVRYNPQKPYNTLLQLASPVRVVVVIVAPPSPPLPILTLALPSP